MMLRSLVKMGKKSGPALAPSLPGIFDNTDDRNGSHSSGKNHSDHPAGTSGQQKRFVTMPYPVDNLGFYDPNARCPTVVKSKFDQLRSFKGSEHTAEFEQILQKFTPAYRGVKFHLLRDAIGQLSSQRGTYFSTVFPGIVSLAQKLPELFKDRPLEFLPAGSCNELSRKEIASLLANAFLCTFPNRDARTTLPTVNFIKLFSNQLGKDKRESSKVEKLKCLFAYFLKAREFLEEGSQEGEEKVTFTKVATCGTLDWRNSIKPMKGFHVEGLDRKIEDSHGIQVDFANKLIGGGVIGRGCLQEEIRFITCPELIVARLFTMELKDNEALVISNFWQYSHHSGYQDDFKCLGPFKGSNGQKRTLVAIDATDFSCEVNGNRQYTKLAIDRELNKAYTGFLCSELSQNIHIATGNWGGGSFKGDPVLKAMIQHVAASEAGRQLYYFPYYDASLKAKLEGSELATRHKRTVGEAYGEILEYAGRKQTQSRY